MPLLEPFLGDHAYIHQDLDDGVIDAVALEDRWLDTGDDREAERLSDPERVGIAFDRSCAARNNGAASGNVDPRTAPGRTVAGLARSTTNRTCMLPP
jgi:hypothetical protein